MKMNKKILMGSMLVLTLLLLMPSIPAIQQNIVKDEFREKIESELFNDLDFKDIRELLNSGKLDGVKHPILGLLVIMWMYFRFLRCQIFTFSYDITIDDYWNIDIEIHNPIIFFRFIILFFNTKLVIHFFEVLSNMFGWNWNIPYY